MIASVGRIVHYVLEDRYGQLHHRPAIVVRNWNLEAGMDPEGGCVQLQVFTDESNDGPQYESGLYWATSVVQDEETKAARTWHWPERE